MTKEAIILLSGGLDSLVCLDIAKKDYDIKLALFFDYSQRAYEDELNAVKKICKHYNINLEIIKLDFLKKITNNALTDKNNNNFDDFNSIWIPNRNGLFLNIGACYCDKYKYEAIILGANKKEAQSFVDNSVDFIQKGDEFFKYSTQHHPKIIAPCLQFDKIQIINYAIDNNVPLNLIKSCYKESTNGKKHCLECASCKLLYEAIMKSKKPELIKELF